MRIVYLGTPSFAVPPLEAIIANGHDVVAVFTQPDRPKGRGQQLAPSPVKECALAHQIPVHQPERIRRPEAVELLRGLHAEAMVVVGYGQIIPQSILDLPPLGIVNVHASLLPAYRGAAPIQWAIANGETITGVTTMKIDAGLDTGDILLMQESPVGPNENAVELSSRLSILGAVLLTETLTGLAAGTIVPRPQDNSRATYAPILKKEDGRIDWNLSSSRIECRVRGFLPWPGCYTAFRGQRLHVWKAKVHPSPAPADSYPGVVFSQNSRLFAVCGEGSTLELLEVQIEGRKKLDSRAFLNGHRLVEYERLGGESNI